MCHVDSLHRPRQPARRARIGFSLCSADLRLRLQFSVHDRLRNHSLLSVSRQRRARRRGELETGGGLSTTAANSFPAAGRVFEWMRRPHRYRGDLERHSGFQAAGSAQCGEDAHLDGGAANDDVCRDQRNGLLLSRASARERDSHLAVRAHHLYRADGVVLLRRLSSLLARDRFMPRQFATRGDRLVFSNGIIILAVFSAILVAAFGGDTSRLIPLYAVGVFLSFTLSQLGMVRHWLKAGRALRSAGAASAGTERSASGAEKNVAAATADSRTPGQVELTRDELKQARHWKKSIVING
ncbi:MAG: hypothetical protein DMF70_04510, partial [Acidobacteria bacterium]